MTTHFPNLQEAISEKAVGYLAGLVGALEEQNKRYREALEWYADEENWDFEFFESYGVPGSWRTLHGYVDPDEYEFTPDNGDVARRALEEPTD